MDACLQNAWRSCLAVLSFVAPSSSYRPVCTALAEAEAEVAQRQVWGLTRCQAAARCAPRCRKADRGGGRAERAHTLCAVATAAIRLATWASERPPGCFATGVAGGARAQARGSKGVWARMPAAMKS